MKYDDYIKFTEGVTRELNDHVFNLIYRSLQAYPNLRETLNPAFPFPKLLRIGILDNCLAIEYQGPEIEEGKAIGSGLSS